MCVVVGAEESYHQDKQSYCHKHKCGRRYGRYDTLEAPSQSHLNSTCLCISFLVI